MIEASPLIRLVEVMLMVMFMAVVFTMKYLVVLGSNACSYRHGHTTCWGKSFLLYLSSSIPIFYTHLLLLPFSSLILLFSHTLPVFHTHLFPTPSHPPSLPPSSTFFFINTETNLISNRPPPI
ncbi:hypothetical protein FKM95_000008 [Candidatus Tremblaya phenacola]|nr:hypothetical protein FKM95_000008 [Candidatus Tremblaya phenacola]